jgi:hypothetical protein
MSTYTYVPTQASSIYNSGTGRYQVVTDVNNLAPEWDGNIDSVPPGYGVIRVEMGREQHETDAVSTSVNGFKCVIPRGSARIVSSVHINRLLECIITEYTQTQYYRPPEGYQRPRFPVTIIVPVKEGGAILETKTGNEVKAEAKSVKAPRKTRHQLVVGENEPDPSANS